MDARGVSIGAQWGGLVLLKVRAPQANHAILTRVNEKEGVLFYGIPTPLEEIVGFRNIALSNKFSRVVDFLSLVFGLSLERIDEFFWHWLCVYVDRKDTPLDVVLKKAREYLPLASMTWSLGGCPRCRKGEVIERTNGYGCIREHSGCRFWVYKTVRGVGIATQQMRSLLAGETLAACEIRTAKTPYLATRCLVDGKLVFTKVLT